MERTYALDSILLREESLNIEFKEYWYWTQDDEKKGKINYDELKKDFVAMINTIVFTENKKYFIVGVSDSPEKRQYNDYYTDVNGNEIHYLMKDISEIKKDIIDKILNSFEAVMYENGNIEMFGSGDGHNKSDIKKILNDKILFEEIEYNKRTLLLIEIENDIPFLLRLKKGNNLKGYREYQIIIRKLDKYGKPEIGTIESYTGGLSKIENRIKENLIKHRFEAVNSLEFVVNVYKKYKYPTFEVKKIIKEHDIRSYSDKGFLKYLQ